VAEENMSETTSARSYSFLYRYNNSADSYFGTVVEGAGVSFVPGQRIPGADGTYTIIGTGQDSSSTPGTVVVAAYFSAAARSEFPAVGQVRGTFSPSGTGGLGSGQDSLFSPGGIFGDTDVPFGPAAPLRQLPRTCSMTLPSPTPMAAPMPAWSATNPARTSLWGG
jgi:hypothetical protein